jgi:hypothetical protein
MHDVAPKGREFAQAVERHPSAAASSPNAASKASSRSSPKGEGLVAEALLAGGWTKRAGLGFELAEGQGQPAAKRVMKQVKSSTFSAGAVVLPSQFA